MHARFAFPVPLIQCSNCRVFVFVSVKIADAPDIIKRGYVDSAPTKRQRHEVRKPSAGQHLLVGKISWTQIIENDLVDVGLRLPACVNEFFYLIHPARRNSKNKTSNNSVIPVPAAYPNQKIIIKKCLPAGFVQRLTQNNRS